MTERSPPQAKSAGQSQWQQGQSGSASGQQHQFDAHGGRQPSGGGSSDGGLAERIREHSPVLDSNGNQVGLVDHVRDGRIQLTRDAQGEHRYIPLDLVIGVDSSGVRLRERGDNDFGVEAGA